MPIAFAIILAAAWLHGGVPNLLLVQYAASDSSRDADWRRSSLRQEMMREETRVQVECSRSGADLDKCARALDLLRTSIRSLDK